MTDLGDSSPPAGREWKWNGKPGIHGKHAPNPWPFADDIENDQRCCNLFLPVSDIEPPKLVNELIDWLTNLLIE